MLSNSRPGVAIGTAEAGVSAGERWRVDAATKALTAPRISTLVCADSLVRVGDAWSPECELR
jgi:hypothetical protein